MNFTVGVAGRGAVTIGFKGFGSFIFYFTLTLSDKRGITGCGKLTGGRKPPIALCVGLITESLKRRFDETFGVTLREGGRNELRASSIARDDRSGGTRSRTNNTDSPADCTEGELELRLSSKSFGPVPGAFEYKCERATVVEVWSDGPEPD
jgi:hypothetical protein